MKKYKSAPRLSADVRQAVHNVIRLIVELDDILTRLNAFKGAGGEFHSGNVDADKAIGDAKWDLAANLLPRYLTNDVTDEDIRLTRLLVELPAEYAPPTAETPQT